MIGRRDIFFFVPALLFSILTPLFLPTSSVSLSYFVLAVPMRKCLRKHSCMSSPFPIAILNGTFFFRSVHAMNNWKRSAIKQILLLLSITCIRHPLPYLGHLITLLLPTLTLNSLLSHTLPKLTRQSTQPLLRVSH